MSILPDFLKNIFFTAETYDIETNIIDKIPLETPANIETINAKHAIEKGYYTKEQLLRCHPEKAKALTSYNALWAITLGLLEANKLYKLSNLQIKNLTTRNAIKALDERLLEANKLYQFDEYKIESLTSDNALKALRTDLYDANELYDFNFYKIKVLTSDYALKLKQTGIGTPKLEEYYDKYKQIDQFLDIIPVKKTIEASPNTGAQYESHLSKLLLSGKIFSAHSLVINGAYFNDYDFNRPEYYNAKKLIDLMEEYFSDSEIKQMVSKLEPSSPDCKMALYDHCVIKASGDTLTTNDSI